MKAIVRPLIAALVFALFPAKGFAVDAKPKAHLEKSQQFAVSIKSDIWIGVIHGRYLFPMGLISKGIWRKQWDDTDDVLRSKPPKIWFVDGAGSELLVSQLKKIEIGCDKKILGYRIADKFQMEEDTVVFSMPVRDLVDKSKLNWRHNQESGSGESVSWSQSLGTFGLEGGKLSIGEGGGYESLEFSVKWEPEKGSEVTDWLSAGGC
jgi:hypothetical protein